MSDIIFNESVDSSTTYFNKVYFIHNLILIINKIESLKEDSKGNKKIYYRVYLSSIYCDLYSIDIYSKNKIYGEYYRSLRFSDLSLGSSYITPCTLRFSVISSKTKVDNFNRPKLYYRAVLIVHTEKFDIDLPIDLYSLERFKSFNGIIKFINQYRNNSNTNDIDLKDFIYKYE